MIALVVTMVFLVNKNQQVTSTKLLSVDTYYSYLDQEEEDCYVDFYVNTSDHEFINVQSYENLKIHNVDHSKSMELILSDIIFLHEESYLNEMYYKYSYVFKMPLLGYDFDIDQCFLEVLLVNGESFDFFIGSISFKTVEDELSHLNWTALSGNKATGHYLSRLHEIHVEFSSINAQISNISIGSLYDVSYQVHDELLVIKIPYTNQLFTACPIVIEYDNHQKQSINYFVYMKDFETLKQSGQLIYHYALN